MSLKHQTRQQIKFADQIMSIFARYIKRVFAYQAGRLSRAAMLGLLVLSAASAQAAITFNDLHFAPLGSGRHASVSFSGDMRSKEPDLGIEAGYLLMDNLWLSMATTFSIQRPRPHGQLHQPWCIPAPALQD